MESAAGEFDSADGEVLISGAEIARPVLSISADGGLAVPGEAGRNYRLEHASELQSANAWIPFATVTLTNGFGVIADQEPRGVGNRFYRAALVP